MPSSNPRVGLNQAGSHLSPFGSALRLLEALDISLKAGPWDTHGLRFQPWNKASVCRGLAFSLSVHLTQREKKEWQETPHGWSPSRPPDNSPFSHSRGLSEKECPHPTPRSPSQKLPCLLLASSATVPRPSQELRAVFEMEKMSLFKNALINQRENKMSPMTHAVQP